MNVYVDTSVLLRVVLGEPRPLRQWGAIDMALASELIRVEALRTIDRARIELRLEDEEIATKRAEILRALDGFHLARLDGVVLQRASDPFPTLVRTLDAIHLTTALLARSVHSDLLFATHDRGLALAARAVGFQVIGVGR